MEESSITSIDIKGYITLSDTRIYYEVKGSGPPVLFLHGNSESLRIFDNMISYFDKSYRTVALDTRGHGNSERGSSPFTFQTFARDVYGAMEQLQIHNAHLIGYSDGGNTALHFAMRYPHKVRSLTLLGANLFPSGMVSRYYFLTLLSCQAMKVLSRLSSKKKPQLERLELMACQPTLTAEVVEKISCPTLVLAGEKDMIRPQHTLLIADSIPKAQLSILPDTNHFQLPASHLCIQRIAAFLEECTERTQRS